MLEYDVVMKCKEGHKPSLQALYFKYIPFINKHYYKMQKQFYFKIPMEREDFEVEGYAALVKAIEYVDPDKITDKEKWLFIGVFGYYLNMLRKSCVMSYMHQQANETPLYVKSRSSSDEYCVADNYAENESRDMTRGIEEETFIDQFRSNLNDFERLILSKRLEIREEGKPRSLQSIAGELGCSFSKIQSANKRIETIYRTMRE